MMGMFDLGSGAMAENIAVGYDTGESVFNGWKNSKGHYANMIGGYTHIGIGKSPGSYYWTQNFGIYRAKLRFQLTNSRGKAIKKQKTVIIGDPKVFAHNQTYTSDENGVVTTGKLLYDTWDMYYDGARQKGVVLVNGDSPSVVQNVSMGRPSNRRPGEQLLTNTETIIIIGVLAGVFVASAVIFGVICYKKNCCPGVPVYASQRKPDDNALLESDVVSYTVSEKPKKAAKQKKPEKPKRAQKAQKQETVPVAPTGLKKDWNAEFK